jgi:glutamyl-tRNA synthetase
MIKVRFAPSPTGYLHVGNARTALMNYLFAQKEGGIFVLRIEDTDVERSEAVYEASITKDLGWLGIQWDEGPVRQSDRIDLYREYASKLLEKGAAYRCFCSRERLEEMRQRALSRKEPPRYDGTCLRLTADESQGLADGGKPYVVRFKSMREPVTFTDIIHGRIDFPADHVDDFIILKQELMPSYNFAATVDDMVMGISHVIRGADHISNTPKQIMLLKTLGCTPPVYAHHSLLTGADRKPLSKRHGATRVMEFREMGILRQALINYLAINGRNVDEEIMDGERLVSTFSLSSFSASDSLFDVEKLLWLNREHMMKSRPLDLCAAMGLSPDQADRVAVLRENAKTLEELRELLDIFEGTGIAEEGIVYLSGIERLADIIALVEHSMSAASGEGFDGIVERLVEIAGLKKRDLFMTLRLLLRGRKKGPPMHEVYMLMEKDHVMARIAWLKARLSLI